MSTVGVDGGGAGGIVASTSATSSTVTRALKEGKGEERERMVNKRSALYSEATNGTYQVRIES